VSSVFDSIKVVDSDSHVVEPPDLWSSRLAAKWVEDAPRVAREPHDDKLRWNIGGRWSQEIGMFAVAGFKDCLPAAPRSFEEMDAAAFDATERLRRLDEYGIWAQVLYPNVIGFDISLFIEQSPEFALACVQAYNDFILEWASADLRRLIPIMMMPFWDIDASIAEMERNRSRGIRSTLFGGHMERIGLPPVYDEHWDPVWAAAQDLDMSVNFHIGFAEQDAHAREAFLSDFAKRKPNSIDISVKNAVMLFLNNVSTVCDVILGGVTHRFPRLQFVSVESGFGWVPFQLDAMDWMWLNVKGRERMPERDLPSEYFLRQFYATFWFETSSLPMLTLLQDNLMYETDFPHTASISPGPASVAPRPGDHIRQNLADVPADIVRKVLYDNAAQVYKLDTIHT
jgi:predicted TIM-barrel fold metal-dependent hydrolase